MATLKEKQSSLARKAPAQSTARDLSVVFKVSPFEGLNRCLCCLRQQP